MKVYLTPARDRSYVQVLALALGGGKGGRRILGDISLQVGGHKGETDFMGWTLKDLLKLGAGEQDIEPKGRDRDDTENEEG